MPKIFLDKCWLNRFVKEPKDIKKVLTIPPVDAIIALCKDKEIAESLPDEWLSDELFYGYLNENHPHTYEVVKRFVDTGKLPKLTREQKETLVSKNEKIIRFFPELPYKIWFDNAYGLEHSGQVPKKYLDQGMLVELIKEKVTINPALITDVIIDTYIETHESLAHIPKNWITLERIKRLLSKRPDYSLNEDNLKGIVIDEELADLMIVKGTDNIKYIPEKYLTRDRALTIIVNETKQGYSSYRYMAPFLKKKNWIGMKFYMELLEKAGDKGIGAILKIDENIDGKLDKTALVQAYPGAIRDILKTEQNKAMATAVLASARCPELSKYLSLKFITKTTSPLFLSSENKEVVDKVERVLTGKPKYPEPPPYSITPGDEIELDLTDEDINYLRQGSIPYIVI